MTCCCNTMKLGFGGISAKVGKSPADILAEEINNKVVEAGGNVNGALRVSMYWESWSDLDLKIVESYTEGGASIIDYNNKVSPVTGGILDVDMNIGSETLTTPTREKDNPAVENIVYDDKDKIKDGEYRIQFTQYGVNADRKEDGDLPYLLIETRTTAGEEMEHFVIVRLTGAQLTDRTTLTLATLYYTKEGGFVLKSIGENVVVVTSKNFKSEVEGV